MFVPVRADETDIIYFARKHFTNINDVFDNKYLFYLFLFFYIYIYYLFYPKMSRYILCTNKKTTQRSDQK